jgi:hypothetical protein
MLTISASHETELEGTVLKLAARDIRLASCKLEFNIRSEEVGYIAGEASEACEGE